MNKSWSELNRKMQIQLKKEATFSDGIETLFELRKELMQAADGFFRDFSREEFCAMSFINAEGYHSKTVAYSLWHIFRIEDIVANTLIADYGQVFFRGNYKERTNSPIITTGNELVKQQIAEFSRQLNLGEVQNYIHEVKAQTEKILCAGANLSRSNSHKVHGKTGIQNISSHVLARNLQTFHYNFFKNCFFL